MFRSRVLALVLVLTILAMPTLAFGEYVPEEEVLVLKVEDFTPLIFNPVTTATMLAVTLVDKGLRWAMSLPNSEVLTRQS